MHEMCTVGIYIKTLKLKAYLIMKQYFLILAFDVHVMHYLELKSGPQVPRMSLAIEEIQSHNIGYCVLFGTILRGRNNFI